MKTRMQPIGTIWNKFPRIVRDLARSCEKKVRIELKGKETELDRTIVEAIKDPLVHIVRNAVDHGIERPERASPPGSPRWACSACARITRAGRSISRSPTTAAASTSSG